MLSARFNAPVSDATVDCNVQLAASFDHAGETNRVAPVFTPTPIKALSRQVIRHRGPEVPGPPGLIPTAESRGLETVKTDFLRR